MTGPLLSVLSKTLIGYLCQADEYYYIFLDKSVVISQSKHSENKSIDDHYLYSTE